MVHPPSRWRCEVRAEGAGEWRWRLPHAPAPNQPPLIQPVRGQTKGKVETPKGYYLAFMDGRSIRADIRPPGLAGGERGHLAPSGRQQRNRNRPLPCVCSSRGRWANGPCGPGTNRRPGRGKAGTWPLGGPGWGRPRKDDTSLAMLRAAGPTALVAPGHGKGSGRGKAGAAPAGAAGAVLGTSPALIC